MTPAEIRQNIAKYVEGQGNQAGLEKLAEILVALLENESTLLQKMESIKVNLSAFETVELNPEEATDVGFTPEIISYLMTAEHPTVQFSDWTITFNTYEHITDELAIVTAVVFDASDDTVFHSALYLYNDGRIFYNIEIIQH